MKSLFIRLFKRTTPRIAKWLGSLSIFGAGGTCYVALYADLPTGHAITLAVVVIALMAATVYAFSRIPEDEAADLLRAIAKEVRNAIPPEDEPLDEVSRVRNGRAPLDTALRIWGKIKR